MIKKLSVLITAVMLLVSVPVAVNAERSGTCGENLTWTFADGLLTISGTGTMRDYLPGDGIGGAPWSYETIKRVEIKNGVTSIGEYAFFECALESVEIASSVTSIGEWAFAGCPNLKCVEIPSSVTGMGEDVFLNCQSLERISVDASNKSYCSEDGVLYDKNKTSLVCYPDGKEDETYKMPAGVQTIGDSAFDYCKALKSISVEASSRYFSSEDGVLFNKNKTILIVYPLGKREVTYAIPNGVTSAAGAFRYRYVKTLILPSSMKSIGNYAFYSAYIDNFEIPASVTSIGAEAFNYGRSSVYYRGTEEQWNKIKFADFAETSEIAPSEAFKNVYYNAKAPEFTYSGSCGGNLRWEFSGGTLTISGTGKMDDWNNAYDSPWGTFRVYTDTIKIEDGVETIGAGAFYSFIALKNVSMPSSVRSIGETAFSKCSQMKNINIPNSVTVIGNSAFSGCTDLKSINIPSGITAIEKYTFSGCAALMSVNIPLGVTAIGEYAFNSSGLTDVYYGGDAEDWAAVLTGAGNDPLTEAEIHYTPTKFAGMPTVTKTEDGAYTVSTNIKDIDNGCAVITVLTNGRKIIDAKTAVVSAGETSAEVTVNGSNPKTVQVFIWDGLENMKPLCLPRTITIE